MEEISWEYVSGLQAILKTHLSLQEKRRLVIGIMRVATCPDSCCDFPRSEDSVEIEREEVALCNLALSTGINTNIQKLNI